jgi:hypothetical protein
MKTIQQKLEYYILNNYSWAFIAAIFFVSNVMTQQQDTQTWAIYSIFILKISLVFLPALLFVTFRDQIKAAVHQYLYWGGWLLCFAVYPFILLALQVHYWLAGPSYGEFIVFAIWYIFMSIEIVIQISAYLSKKNRLWNWLKQFNLEQGLLFFIFILGLLYIIFVKQLGAPPLNEASFLTLLGYTVQMIIILLIYYGFYLINHYFLVSRLFQKRGIVYYMMGFAATLIFLYPIAAQLIAFLPITKETEIHPLNSVSVFNEINFAIPFAGMLLSIPFIWAIQWWRQSNELIALSKEKSETELALLKQQINPHFFFNTLNNLYALSRRQAPETPEVILQLSELMRYTIYKGKEKLVPIEEEVQYIEDYIKLQQIRLHKKLTVQFDKNIEQDAMLVPPLLFITFVENAFKHGIEPAEKDCYLSITLTANHQYLYFKCENSIEEPLDNTSKGIGLENLMRRLALLYPDQHTLNTKSLSNAYIAELDLTANYYEIKMPDH